MAEIWKRYKKIKKIGAGTYGTVYLARGQETEVAIKVSKTRTKFLDDDQIREVDFLNRFDHPNVIKAIETKVWTDEVYLVLKYYPMDLYKYMESPGKSLIDRLDVFKKVTCGLLYLHTNWVIHADFKPDNILVAENSIPVIADFGMSINFGPTPNNRNPLTNRSVLFGRTVGTSWWRAPELFVFGFRNSAGFPKFRSLPKKYFFGPETDVYSLAWVGLELVFGIEPLHLDDNLNSVEILHSLGVRFDPIFGPFIKNPNMKIEKPGVFEGDHPSEAEKLWSSLKTIILSPPLERPTCEDLLKIIDQLPIKTGICEKKRIEYPAFKPLDVFSKSLCFPIYMEARKYNISLVKKVLETADLPQNLYFLILSETIDILDRLYSGDQFFYKKYPDDILILAASIIANGLYGISAPWLREDQARALRTALPLFITFLDYKIFRPSLFQMGMSIEDSIKCYEISLVPTSIKFNNGVCEVTPINTEIEEVSEVPEGSKKSNFLSGILSYL